MLKSTKKWTLLAAVGLLSGAINGLLGAGGGIVITYFLSYLFKGENIDKNSIFANALITMIPISLLSFAIYLARGYVKLEWDLFYLTLPALIGGALGALLLKKINFKLTKLIFCAVVIWSGVSMLMR